MKAENTLSMIADNLYELKAKLDRKLITINPHGFLGTEIMPIVLQAIDRFELYQEEQDKKDRKIIYETGYKHDLIGENEIPF